MRIRLPISPLLCLLALAGHAAHADWQTLKAKHFIIHYTSERDFAKDVTRAAERDYETVARDLGLAPATRETAGFCGLGIPISPKLPQIEEWCSLHRLKTEGRDPLCNRFAGSSRVTGRHRCS